MKLSYCAGKWRKEFSIIHFTNEYLISYAGHICWYTFHYTILVLIEGLRSLKTVLSKEISSI